MIQHIYTTQNLPSGSILMKSPDKGKTGTKYRISFFAGYVSFMAVASVYLATDNNYLEIPITNMPGKYSKIETLENYLRNQNHSFPLYRLV